MNIVISGGTSGVGYSIAKSLISKENSLIIIGRNKNKGSSALLGLGGNVVFIQESSPKISYRT